ncbi:U3 small nucleolar RNA-associated protein 18 like protein [Myotis brandtii]|uniref:U3 small nucleolar RNA-associated protein 18 like protein n=1 Tax=Myotis brandtii TaxID=109478 RepID=S7PLL9_MYOBR|nr:U3 small nucleolar RNA-associated protein 18 like protein [Myotis brandtii]
MPPERRSRTTPERRTGSRPNRKIPMKPDRKAGAGPGGPPRKAAYSSQRKPPAAAAAITMEAAEESRLQELHRLTLEEDKPTVERCLEELVFGDTADNEDALLRRWRGPRVQVQEDSGDSEVENEAKDNFPPQKKPVWVDEEDEDGRPRLPRRRGSCCAWYPAGAQHLCVWRTVVGSIFRGSAPRVLILRVPPSGASDRLPPYLAVQVQEDSGDSEVENEAKDNFPPQKKPVWVDEEDEDEEMVDMMNNRFRKDMMKNASEKKLSKNELQKRLKEEFQHAMGGVPAWVETNKRKASSDDESEEDEDDLLQRTGNFISTSTSLPKGILKMKNCLHANAERPTTARISSVQFHPGAQVVMVAALDNSVSLFQVDGKTNPKIQSIYLEKFPIFKARFSANGEEVLATSTHSKVLYVYDMLAGKLIPVHQVRGLKEKIVRDFEVSSDGSFLLINGVAGYFHLLSMKTKELISSMKVNGRIAASTFSSDSKKVYASSADGEVYVWDVNSRKCLNRFVDEGSLYGLSIAASRNGQYVACG